MIPKVSPPVCQVRNSNKLWKGLLTHHLHEETVYVEIFHTGGLFKLTVVDKGVSMSQPVITSHHRQYNPSAPQACQQKVATHIILSVYVVLVIAYACVNHEEGITFSLKNQKATVNLLSLPKYPFSVDRQTILTVYWQNEVRQPSRNIRPDYGCSAG